jgi:enoyl-CoA hydratase/carnithine racemase
MMAVNASGSAVENKVATITLNRPEKLNAFSDELVVALNTMLRRFDSRRVVRSALSDLSGSPCISHAADC